jgi:hypothetical protein
MTRYRDYTEWDSTLEQREAETEKNENPFQDPEVQSRMAELISGAAERAKKPLTRRPRQVRAVCAALIRSYQRCASSGSRR